MLKAKGKHVSIGVLLLAAVLFGVLGLWQTSAARATGTWTDLTEVAAAENLTETEYQISDAAGLGQLAQWVNQGTDFRGITLHIVSDIDLTGITVSPIGNKDAGFSGTLSGLKTDNTTAKISGLTQTGENYLGLFGRISGEGRVENLELTAASVSGKNTVALLAAQNDGAIENVSVSNGILSGAGVVGGIVGINNGTMTDVTASGLTVTGNNAVGGLIGQNSGTLTNSQNLSGALTGTTALGGLAGINYGQVSSSWNAASVSGTEGSTVSMIGGVVGSNYGIVSDVQNLGSVVVTSSGTFVGGIAGFNVNETAQAVTAENAAQAPVRIENALNLGSVTSSADYTAGLVAHNERAAVLNSYSAGTVTSDADNVFAGSDDEVSAWSSYTVLGTVNGSMIYAEVHHGLDASFDLRSFEGLSEETVTLSDGKAYAAALQLNGPDGVFSVKTPEGFTVAFERQDPERENPVISLVFELENEIFKSEIFVIPTKNNEFTAEYTEAGYVLTGLNENYVSYTGNLTAIPSVWTDNIHGEAPVVGIAAGAFAQATTIAQLELPASLTSLGAGAFPYGTGEGQTQLAILSSKAQYDALTAGLPETDLSHLTCKIMVILSPNGGTMPDEVIYQRLYNRALNFAQIEGVWQTEETFALPTAVTRTGYTLTGWQYGNTRYQNDTLLLPEGENLTLAAVWALAAPSVAEISDVAAGYGQIPSITVSASHDLGVTFSYAWYKLDAETDTYLLLPETSATLTLTDVADTGNYKVTVTAALGQETASADQTFAVSVAKAELTVVFADYEGLVYDGTEKTISATFAGLFEGDDFTPVLTYDPAEVVNAGTYTATASLPEGADANYTLTGTLTQEFTVAKAELTVIFADYEGLVYDGTEKTISASFAGLFEGDDFAPVLTYDPAEVVNAGTYTATASLPEGADANYTLTGTLTQEFIVAKAELTVVFADYEGLIYDGTEKTISASFAGLIGEDELTPVLTYDPAEVRDAGTYTATASLPTEGADNYVLTGTVTQEFTVAGAALTVTFSDYEGLVYDGTVKAVTAAFVGLGEGDDFAPVITYDREPRAAGTYTATAALPEEARNYALTGTVTCEFTIAKAELTVVFSDTVLPYNGQVQSLTAAFEGLADGDELTPAITYDREPLAVGTYTATAALPESESAENYVLTGTLTSEFVITKADLTVSFGKVDLTYNGEDRKNAITASFVGLQNEDELHVVFTFSAEEVVNAGTYTVTASLPEGAEVNYTLTGEQTLTFEIKKAPLTVAFTDYDSLIYNGRVQQISASLVGLVAGETLAPVLTYDGEVLHAGTYTATAALPDSEVAENYVLTGETSQIFSVAKRDLTVGFDEMDLTYNGQDRRADINVAFLRGLQGSDTLTLSLSFAQNGAAVSEVKNAGIYTVTVGLPDNDVAKNYALDGQETTTRTFEITRRAVQVVLTGAEGLVYDGTEKVIGISFTNIVEGEILQPDYTFGDNVILKDAGDYTLTVFLPETAVAQNYTLEAEAITVTILKATLTVTFEGTEGLIYDGTDQTVTASASGFVPGEEFELVLTGNVARNAGTYTVTAALPETEAARNYLLDQTEQTYTIAKRQVEPAFSVSELTYSGADQRDNLPVTFANTVEGETLIYAFTADPAEFKNVGVYTLTLALTGDEVNANYELTGTLTTTVTILPVTLTARFENVTMTYNGAIQVLVASFDGVVSGETLTPVVTYNAEAKNVGDYVATISLPDNDVAKNYVLTGSTTMGFSILPAQLTVTFEGLDGLVYDGTVKTITATFAGLVEGDELSPALTFSADVLQAGDYTVTAALPETDTARNYTLTGTVTATFSVAKADPQVNLPAGLTATYGDTLADVILPAGWSWTDASASVGNVGANAFEAIFTPDDVQNYNTVSATVTVTVDKAVAPVQPLDKLTAYYRDQLSDIRLPNGWSWVHPEDEVGEIGTTQHMAVYHAEDGNYTDAQVMLEIVVQARPFSCDSSVSGASALLSVLALAGVALARKKK